MVCGVCCYQLITSSSVVLMCLLPFVTLIIVILTTGTKSDVMNCFISEAGDLPRTSFGQPPIPREIIMLGWIYDNHLLVDSRPSRLVCKLIRSQDILDVTIHPHKSSS